MATRFFFLTDNDLAMRLPLPWAAFAILTLVLSGCQGPADRDGAGGRALPYSFQDGAIEGLAIDDQGTPIAGALIIVQGPGLRAKSGPTGSFILRHVPPGTQTLSAQAEGFAGAELVVHVEVAAITNTTLVLARLAEVEVYIDRARIDFTLGILGGRMVAQGLIEGNVDTFSHPLQRTPVTIVSTTRWEPPAPPGPARMSLSLHMAGPPGNQSVGTSPLTVRIDLGDDEEKMAFNLTFSPPPGCALLGPCMLDEDGLFVARDITATVVTAAFFKERPATDFIAEEPAN